MTDLRADGWRRTNSGAPMVDGGDASLDRVLEAVSAPRCRYVLYGLMESEPQDLESLAETVLAWETDRSVDQVAEDRRTRVLVDLYHHQLPRLDGLHLVEYDPRSKVVSYRDPPEHLEEILDVCQTIETP